MGIEYRIRFDIPRGYDAAPLEGKLPDRVDAETGQEIYTWEIEGDGFYFVTTSPAEGRPPWHSIEWWRRR